MLTFSFGATFLFFNSSTKNHFLFFKSFSFFYALAFCFFFPKIEFKMQNYKNNVIGSYKEDYFLI